MSDPKAAAKAAFERAKSSKPNGRPLPDDCYPPDQIGDAFEGEIPPPLGIRLADLKPERVRWLWPGRIPLGKITILDGDPGLGKSVLTMDLAASLSAGLALPDGAHCQVGGVVLLTAEDGLTDTVLPRLQAAGADVERITALETVLDAQDGLPRPPRLPDDVDQIAEVVREVKARMIVIDPLMAFLGGYVNSHRDQDVRRALHPLAKMAEKTGAAVVIVRHLNKGGTGSPIYRGGGSIGIIGAARSGLLVAKDLDDPSQETRVLASTKCNLAKRPASLAYRIEEADNGSIRLAWLGESAHTAESLLAAPVSEEDKGALKEAEDVLREILSEGSKPAALAKSEAHKAGIAARTLDRAKATLRVKAAKVGASWMWSLPVATQ